MTQPPLGSTRPAFDQTCGRLFADDTHCGKPATWHVMWNDGTDNGLCCDEHYDEALGRWYMHDKHPITAVCTMPDAGWLWSWEEPPGGCRWIVSDDTMALAHDATKPPAALHAGGNVGAAGGSGPR